MINADYLRCFITVLMENFQLYVLLWNFCFFLYLFAFEGKTMLNL